MAVTERSGHTPPQRRRNLPWSDRTVEQVVVLPNWAVPGIKAAQINPALTTDSWVLRQLASSRSVVQPRASLGRPAGWSRDRLRRGATPGARSAGSRVWMPPAAATRHGGRV